MRPLPTNIVPTQHKTWVIGGTVYLLSGVSNYSGRIVISFTGTTPGQYTLIRAANFTSLDTGPLYPGANLLPFFQVDFSELTLALQSFSLDSTGREAILVVRPKST